MSVMPAPGGRARAEEGGGEAVADEVDERLGVVDLEGDVPLGAGGGEGAVDGDPGAPGRGAVGEGSSASVVSSTSVRPARW